LVPRGLTMSVPGRQPQRILDVTSILLPALSSLPGHEGARKAPTRCATLPFALDGAPSPGARCMLVVRRRWALQSF
jgi:hypothetical protein